MYSIVFSRAVRNLNRNIRRQKVAYIQLIRYKRQGPLRYFVNSKLKEVVLVFFLIASRIDQMVRRLLTRSSKTRKMFCLSWRKTSIAASGTLWFSPTRITLTSILASWWTTTLVTPNQKTSSCRNTYSLASSLNQSQIRIQPRVSNLMASC